MSARLREPRSAGIWMTNAEAGVDAANSRPTTPVHTDTATADGPPDPTQLAANVRKAVARVSTTFVRPVLEAAQRDGHDVTRFCKGLGFNCKDLENPEFWLSHAEANTVIRRCIDTIKRPSLGLELGMQSNIVSRGIMALGLMASPTLGDAMRLKLRFPGSAGLLLQVSGECDGANYVETTAPLQDNHANVPFLTEKMFASMVKIRRVLTARDYAPSFVDFVHEHPQGNPHAYADFFGCAVRFGAMRNRLASASHWLDVHLPTASEMSYQFACKVMLKETHQAGASSPVMLAVERLIRKGLPHPPHPAQVADSLNMSERSLRRKLAESGTTYQALVDQSRKSRAIELTLSSQLSPQALAAECGFSDVRSFRRAFVRWTGGSVAAARRGIDPSDHD